MSDPNVGRVHRESKRGTQHYLVCTWRDVQYRLTGRFAYYDNVIVAEYMGATGKLWGDEEGNWYPGKTPRPDAIWTEKINWRPVQILSEVKKNYIEDVAKQIAVTNGLDWDKMSEEDKQHAVVEASHSFNGRG